MQKKIQKHTLLFVSQIDTRIMYIFLKETDVKTTVDSCYVSKIFLSKKKK